MRDVRSLVCIAALGAVVSVWGCASSEDTGGGGTGGKGTGGAGTGGTVGTGGSGTGGTVGTGGSGTGGNGTGGVVGTGGSGTGGTVMDGGMDRATMETGGDAASGPATFTELWTTIFSVTMAQSPSSCAGMGCHNPTTSDGVNMSTKMMAYTTLKAKVSTANVASSALVTRLESTDATRRMPLNRPALTAEQKLRVRSWIMNGAKND